ncbi:MAG: type I-C CRISPR-associated endonuclease Cas1c [Phycisphaerales bacterium]|nr:type I-C CRISPR-associated endonuclease Cas1c [Phycisphaerales bacterium]
MKHHLNTLFVTTQGAYLAKDGEAVAVRLEKQTKLRVPLHMLGGICCFGRIGVSPQLMGRCAQAGVAISFLTEYGRLLANVTGFTPGNVLLRREQYRRADDLTSCNGHVSSCLAVVRPIVVAKLLNSRTVLLRGIRDYPEAVGRADLERAAAKLAINVDQAQCANDVDCLRGIEGEAATLYFGVLGHLITQNCNDWPFNGRSRRPPRDPVNALLSFLYTLVHDARSACEAAGLDSQVGFLHRDRPGRPSLALDLMEELRAFLCDRLALSLINRGQVNMCGFRTTETGGVLMDDGTRKTVLTAYQKRKQEDLTHPFLNEKVSVGLLVHLQARLLARHLRGDLDAYAPFVWK